MTSLLATGFVEAAGTAAAIAVAVGGAAMLALGFFGVLRVRRWDRALQSGIEIACCQLGLAPVGESSATPSSGAIRTRQEMRFAVYRAFDVDQAAAAHLAGVAPDNLADWLPQWTDAPQADPDQLARAAIQLGQLPISYLGSPRARRYVDEHDNVVSLDPEVIAGELVAAVTIAQRHPSTRTATPPTLEDFLPDATENQLMELWAQWVHTVVKREANEAKSLTLGWDIHDAVPSWISHAGALARGVGLIESVLPVPVAIRPGDDPAPRPRASRLFVAGLRGRFAEQTLAGFRDPDKTPLAEPRDALLIITDRKISEDAASLDLLRTEHGFRVFVRVRHFAVPDGSLPTLLDEEVLSHLHLYPIADDE